MSEQRRNIFITGGASGIGRAVARHFAERGWFVSIADIDEAGMQDTLGLIEGGFKYSHKLDVRDRAAWDVALESADIEPYLIMNAVGLPQLGGGLALKANAKK